MENSKEPIHIISLGAGVQSSTMALMAVHGLIKPHPRCAIFADTAAEPASVYRWLDWLEKQLDFPVLRVSNGAGLIKDALRIRKRKDGLGCWVPSGIPHYSLNADGSHGHGPRQCTHDFKLTPLRRETRRQMKMAGVKKAVSWIGISLDEAHRMNPANVRYLENRWPLIEMGMKRSACLRWMEQHHYPRPPRSACVMCPYHSDKEWRRLKVEEPDEFAKAVKFEKDYQVAKLATVSMKGFKPFLHNSRIPLDQVEFRSEEEKGQLDMFGNECEGMCGV